MVGRNVLLLALCQALANTATVVLVTVVAIVGTALATDPRFATLAMTTQFLGTMAAIVPASLLMKRLGRGPGFLIGALIGAAGAGLATVAIMAGSLALYCAGTLLHGAAMGFAQFYRFAAADAAPPSGRARAISLVVAGGVVAGVAGPGLAAWSRGWLTAGFAGSHLAMVVLFLATAGFVSLARIPRPGVEEQEDSGRPLAWIMAQPSFILATLAAAVGFSAMMLIMTVTPLAITAHAHDFADAAWVIQWHVLAMFAPSFVTGRLIDRVGVVAVIVAGAAAILACVAINLGGVDLSLNFWPALVLLGLGWNFMYVGGTALLTSAYRPAEKAKTQAASDFILFTAVSAASFGSGALYHALGWQMVNLSVAPVVALVMAALLLLRGRTAAATG